MDRAHAQHVARRRRPFVVPLAEGELRLDAQLDAIAFHLQFHAVPRAVSLGRIGGERGEIVRRRFTADARHREFRVAGEPDQFSAGHAREIVEPCREFARAPGARGAGALHDPDDVKVRAHRLRGGGDVVEVRGPELTEARGLSDAGRPLGRGHRHVRREEHDRRRGIARRVEDAVQRLQREVRPARRVLFRLLDPLALAGHAADRRQDFAAVARRRDVTSARRNRDEADAIARRQSADELTDRRAHRLLASRRDRVRVDDDVNVARAARRQVGAECRRQFRSSGCAAHLHELQRRDVARFAVDLEREVVGLQVRDRLAVLADDAEHEAHERPAAAVRRLFRRAGDRGRRAGEQRRPHDRTDNLARPHIPLSPGSGWCWSSSWPYRRRAA